jgi:hypothetical protein
MECVRKYLRARWIKEIGRKEYLLYKEIYNNFYRSPIIVGILTFSRLG